MPWDWLYNWVYKGCLIGILVPVTDLNGYCSFFPLKHLAELWEGSVLVRHSFSHIALGMVTIACDGNMWVENLRIQVSSLRFQPPLLAAAPAACSPALEQLSLDVAFPEVPVRGAEGGHLSVDSSSETLAGRTAPWNEKAPWETFKYIGWRGQAGDRNWTYWQAEDTCKWEALPAPNPNCHMEFLMLHFEEN